MPYIVTVPQLAARFSVGNDETIVEAATSQGIAFPFSCQSGTCGTCKSKLIAGKVSLLDYSKFTLTDQERASGMILACCAIPESDCELVLAPQATLIQAKRIVCRIAAIRDATHDIKIVQLAFPGNVPPQFLAGQYGDLSFGDLPKRSYSMASRPDEVLLDFHVRLTPGGAVSTALHQTVAPGDEVTFYGPLGTSYLRDDHQGPVLAIAGGSGLGPVKSIIDTLTRRTDIPPIHFYFGVRDERDLYYAEYFRALERDVAGFRFIPVLSASSTPAGYRRGYLADVIAEDFTDLTGFKAYLAGPPIMVETCLEVIQSRGLAAADCHADAF